MSRCAIAAVYAFASLDDLEGLQRRLRSLARAEGVVGTVLLAGEGINGTIAGPPEGVERVLGFLRAVRGLEALEAKQAYARQAPFGRLKIRIKREIVTMGVEGIDPRRRAGVYVEPEAWNAVLEDPETLVVDTRNGYEVRIGSFDGAVDPKTASFRDFPAWAQRAIDPRIHRRVAMFCTGGIRCEKATALLLERGVEHVMHLRGGVLRYLERVPRARSRWRGECFVFDRRVAVDHELRPGRHVLCYGCLEPLAPEDTAHPEYEEGVCCHRCVDRTPAPLRARRRERMRQVRVAQARGEQHLRVGPAPEEL